MCKKFSPTPYPLATVHPFKTDRRTTTTTIARPLLKYSQLKTVPKSYQTQIYSSHLPCRELGITDADA